MKYDDHSLQGYLMRQPICVVKSELARLLLLEKMDSLCSYNLFYRSQLEEVLRLRGESTDIDFSSTIISSHPFIDQFPPRK